MIELDTVTKTFKRHRVLDAVSTSFADGDRVALIGSNGAGKTTLIRCLLGEYKCLGDVRINGMDPTLKRREVLAKVGFVPQLPPPLKMPVGELIRFAASVSHADPADMENVSATLGLDIAAIRHQPFVKLSGGQKQKLLIGIALGRDCDALIMDEPAANLDPESRQSFFKLLAERQNGTVMLISSHRLDEIAALVNRVVELDQGQIVLDDHVADAVDLDAELACTIRLSRKEDAFGRALTEWGFNDIGDGLTWNGSVAGPDRLRFLGMVSRYAGILAGLELQEGGRA
ncbi:MAG: ABC transporter ATP-binding protein [Rhodospirillaceae bacterium]|jgi:ABC-2 type transport system ATP-binding protein|nr:ABC transporter ATP-binding protein [Rhodospirillaceae bacterium]